MGNYINNRIFWGLIIGFVASLIFAIGDIMIDDQGLFMQADTKPDEFSNFVTSSSYRFWAVRGLFTVLLEMYAFICLYLALRNGNSERLAFWALILFMVHITTGQSLFTLLYFVFPEVGKLYNDGVKDVIHLAHMKGELMWFVVGGGIIWIIANVLFAIAIWRDKTFPKYTGILILIGFLLIDAPSPIIQFLANLIWGGTLLWMAIIYRKHTIHLN